MEQNKELELNLSEETIKMLEEYASKKGSTPEDVAEYIIYEFLRNQIHVLERRSEETGVSVDELVNSQFAKILTSLINQKQ